MRSSFIVVRSSFIQCRVQTPPVESVFESRKRTSWSKLSLVFRVLYKSPTVGWIQGEVVQRNVDHRMKIGSGIVNFIFYKHDDHTSKHTLCLQNYRQIRQRSAPWDLKVYNFFNNTCKTRRVSSSNMQKSRIQFCLTNPTRYTMPPASAKHRSHTSP